MLYGKNTKDGPQHLDIPTILESVVEELEGPDLKKRVAIAKQMFLKKEDVI